MRRHSVFLRRECILPSRLDPNREIVGDNWTIVEEIAAPVFDTMIRHAGWHFMRIHGSCARRGFGTTRENATDRALTRALKGIARRFNAAELDSVRIARYAGIYVATVIVQPRQIQQQTCLDVAS